MTQPLRTLLVALLALCCGAAATYLVLRDDQAAGGTAEVATDDAAVTAVAKSTADEVERKTPEYFDMVGRWRPAPTDDAAADDMGLSELNQLGYAGGYEPSPESSGVTFYAPDLAEDGLNLCHDGSGPTAILMDMEGEELHRWAYALEDVLTPEQFAEATTTVGPVPDKTGFWRRVHLFPNGDLLAIFVDSALIKLDRDSKLLWKWIGNPHHDLDVDPETGEIWVLTRKNHIVPRYSRQKFSAEDFVTVLSPDGELVREISIPDAFANSEFNAQEYLMPRGGDLQHTNTIELLEGRIADRIPAFAAGHVLLSMRKTSTIAVLDPQEEVIVWSMAGAWNRQHQPTVLDNGNLLLLDNLGHRGSSKVIEFDPLTQEIHWAYRDSPQTPFSTRTCGSNQRLPGGNTLITETDSGRAIEVDQEGRIVWEYLTPNRAGEDGELIASLFEVIRLAPDAASDWLHD